MSHPQADPVAILLHLANTQHLQEFAAALEQIDLPFDLYVNLVEGLNDPRQLAIQRAQILARFPDARIECSQNRGMDIGGMLRLFDRVKSGPYQVAMYAHSKSSEVWRQRMLHDLTRHARQRIDAWPGDAARQGRRPGMIGSYSYPFDYYNLGPFLDLMAELGITLNDSWEAYFQRYPATRQMPLTQRIAHANDQARLQQTRSELRPEIDLEYAEYLLGDPRTARQTMNTTHLKRLIHDQVMGPLPYFPGNFFWISLALINALAERIDFEQEVRRLPLDLSSDRDQQSRAHAWERALPVFALKNGFTLSSVRSNPARARTPVRRTTAT